MNKPDPATLDAHKKLDWDAAYDNSAHIPDAAAYPERWREKAETFRAKIRDRGEYDIAYDKHDRARLDLFLPEHPPLGLIVFIHGGYWLAFDKSHWSHLAEGAVARQWAVAVPSYPLCPEVDIGAITHHIKTAIATVARRIDGPIRLVGHSSGGQLACRMLCKNVPLVPEIRDRITGVISISGIHDLRPLRHTRINEVLRLDLDKARRESPALAEPQGNARLICWVGTQERPEFRRQSGLLANIWAGLGMATHAVEEPTRNHFNILESLEDPNGHLTRAVIGDFDDC